MVTVAQLGEVEKEKGPVNLFPTERPDSGWSGPVVNVDCDATPWMACTFFIMVTVAQLVEPRIVIPVVVGSSPISHPSFQ